MRATLRVCFSVGLVSLAAVAFGLAIKARQLSAVSSSLLQFYPCTWWLTAVFQTWMVFVTIWIALGAVLLSCNAALRIRQASLMASLPFVIAASASAFGLDFHGQVMVFATALGCMLAWQCWLGRGGKSRLWEALIVAASYAILWCLIYPPATNFGAGQIRLPVGRNDELISYEPQWEAAKAFSFCGPFNQNTKFGAISSNFFGDSELSSLLMLALDTPIVSVEAKYGLVRNMMVGLCVFACFGAYLFLRIGLRLRLLPSLIGGLAYVLANPVVLSLMLREYAMHVGVFFFLPWVLLLIKLGHSRGSGPVPNSASNDPQKGTVPFVWPPATIIGTVPGSLALLMLAGLVMSLTEYALNVHPEIWIYSWLFITIYNLFLCFTSLRAVAGWRWMNLAMRAILPSVGLGFGLCYHWLPRFYDLFTRDFYLGSPYATKGMLWPGCWWHVATLFFRVKGLATERFEHDAITYRAEWFYPGQFTLLLALTLLFILGRRFLDWGKQGRRSGHEGRNAWPGRDPAFFLLLGGFLVVSAGLGNRSWLSSFLALVGLTLHYQPRLIGYYFPCMTIAAMYVLHLLAGGDDDPGERFPPRTLDWLLLLAGACQLDVIIRGASWRSSIHPENLWIELAILAGSWGACAILYRSHRWNVAARWGAAGAVLTAAVFSFCWQSPTTMDFVREAHRPPIKTHSSFRAAVTRLRNNQHDGASFKFLESRWREYLNDSGRQASAGSMPRSRPAQLEFFGAVAEEVDHFYARERADQELDLGSSSRFKFPRYEYQPFSRPPWIPESEYEPFFRPLWWDRTNGAYFSLPDQTATHFAACRDWLWMIIPGGKHGTVCSTLFDNGSPYMSPSIHGYCYLSALCDYSVVGWFTSDANKLWNDPLSRKVANVAGVDYVTYRKATCPYWPNGYVYDDSGPNLRRQGNWRTLYRPEAFSETISESHTPGDRVVLPFFGDRVTVVCGPTPLGRMNVKIDGAEAGAIEGPARLPDRWTPLIWESRRLKLASHVLRLENGGKAGTSVELDAIAVARSDLALLPVKTPADTGVQVLKNPQSYGKVYIASRVKMIRPEDNLANSPALNFRTRWPLSEALRSNFLNTIKTLPSEKYAALIEGDARTADFAPSGTGRVRIIKILGDKAVFDVTCDDNCWVIYNSGLVSGWHAFSGDREVKIHQANLAFIGVNLPKGRHFLWMERRQPARVIGLCVTLAGWMIAILAALVARRQRPAGVLT